MLKLVLGSLLLNNVLSQLSVPGSQNDDHNCVLDGGYTWCSATNRCIRAWETPCSDNYINCNDCLEKQRSGINIACPQECDLMVIDPMPPVVEPPITVDPIPLPPPIPCPDVMCMMYCPQGHRMDTNGCQMCDCKEEDVSECEIVQPSCNDYNFVCPRVTEITNCNNDGIDGYTTFQVSLIIQDNKNIKNIYALFGDEDNIMILPPSYQSVNGENVGGVQSYLVDYYPDMEYDSWLTIGITDGDISNKISSVGIDFNHWDIQDSLSVDNGAIFSMDPEDDIVIGNEYIVGQFTVRTFSNPEIVLNVQGKTIDSSIEKSWIENNIRFNLISPDNPVISSTVPDNCLSWYDGCNTCRVVNGQLSGCTRMMCFREETARCLDYETSGH